MRRCHLRGRDNILKRQLVHVGAFNLSLILRQLLGAGTPRELRNRFGMLVLFVYLLFRGRINQNRLCRSRTSASVVKCFVSSRTRLRRQPCRKSAPCTTACWGENLMRNRTGGQCRLEEAFRQELFRLINQYLSVPEGAP